MLPYLSFGVLVFMLLAGFFLGTMFGYLIKELGARRFGYDPEGGKPLPQTSERGAKIIPFPMKGRRRKAS
jgi:hypothetical protein